MSIDATTALAGLLRDPDLRRRFCANRQATLRSMGVREDLHSSFEFLDAQALEQQAKTLVAKRFRAVEQLLPRTMRALGADALPEFERFAREFWPEGHLRHVVDAASFFRHLRGRRATGVYCAEAHLVSFVADGRRVALRWAPRTYVGGRPRNTVQLLYRRSGRVRQVFLYLGLR